MSPYTDVISTIPPGVIGNAEIVHDSPDKFTRLRAAIHGQTLGRSTYVRLLVDGEVTMTDAEFERRTNLEVIGRAHGDALIAGLGIGLIIDPICKKCPTVTVIEKEQSVIDLVAPHLKYDNLTIIHADILEWLPKKKGKQFDTIYFDIWPHISEDDVYEGKKLEAKFKKYLRARGYMRSWSTLAMKALGR